MTSTVFAQRDFAQRPRAPFSNRPTTVYLLRTLIGATAVLLLGAVFARPNGAAEPAKHAEPEAAKGAAASTPQTPQQAVARATEFLVKDTAKWRNERGCATCHHGVMTVWALGEARRQGYAVDAEKLAEIMSWAKERFTARLDKPRDARPGWNLVSLPSIYYGIMSQDLPILSRSEVNQLSIHLTRHLEADGSWLMPPGANGAPPTWESPETLALLALLAWEPSTPVDPQQADATRTAREKALTWLTKAKPTETTQALALRLVWDLRTEKTGKQLQKSIDLLLGRQNSDGGWSQTPQLSSDAYATGQTLWALSFAEVDAQRPEILRAVKFLTTTQCADGSWPMKSRNHPDVESKRDPLRNPMPITYFGSAWATLGLVRFVPPTLDLAARQQSAFDYIRSLSGKYQIDEKTAGKPVVSVQILYEVEDEELAKLTTLLTAFPELKTLRLKSSRITDAGSASLKSLPQLRKLTLENAPITDAGLKHLETLTALEELNLTGTKVTDAGLGSFKKVLPKAKIER